MIPRMVSSLMFSLARNAGPVSVAISLFPSCFQTLARRRRGRMAPDRAPAALVEHPDVGQHHAILDNPVEVFDPPSRLNGADHHLVERGRVAHFNLDGFDLAPLDCV